MLTKMGHLAVKVGMIPWIKDFFRCLLGQNWVFNTVIVAARRCYAITKAGHPRCGGKTDFCSPGASFPSARSCSFTCAHGILSTVH